MLLSTAFSARIPNHLRERGRPGRRPTLGGSRSSRPLLEVLEDRTLLNVDFVSNTHDSGTGSLRAAISSASPEDTIAFASGVTGTITLSANSGPLDITQNLDIEGPGAGNLKISANGASQVFNVNGGVTASIAGLTIAGASGGGIVNFYSTLTVTNCTLSGNSADYGGGIDNEGTMTVTNCTLSDNSTSFEGGGGIYNDGTMTVTNSTLSGNSASWVGGGGGGIINQGALTITNCTLSDNSAPLQGGAIYNVGGTLTVTNSTLSGNSAGEGGGIDNNQGTATLANTIIAGNTAPTGPDVDGTVTSLGYNLVGNKSGGSGFVAADLLNVNPLLGPLQNNGGPTQSMALLPGSPAIDAGSVALIPSGITTDQRGASRDVDGVDIGAFEVQVYPVYFTIDSGGGSLRSAMTQANQYGGSIIAFTASGVIDLASPLPAISRDVQILGPGANNLTVSGNFASQVFYVNAGVTATIAGLTIADGKSLFGGGIENDGTLTVTNSTLSGNSAGCCNDSGGGIYNGGTLTVTNSTLAGNSAPNGGGIFNDGTLTVTNSTLAGNSAPNGGGIYNLAVFEGEGFVGGTLAVTDSTLSGNSSATGGGGIANVFGTADIANTIVAGNTAPTGPDVYGLVTSKGHNLIGNSSGGGGFVAADLLNVNPVLGPLQNNGGPTPTLALLPGSPAIAAGSVALAVDANGNPLTTDQRGSARVVNGTVDIGAFESRGFTTTVTSGNNQQTAIGTAFTAPLVVTVSSPYGEPVAGGVVTYTAPASGVSATFPGGGNTATIDASGQASIAVAANSVPGNYGVGATARGATGTLFILTNTPGAPNQLVIHTQPSATVKAGQAFAAQPVIYEDDQSGNLETADNSTQVTVSLESGSGPLLGTQTVTVSGGIATFINLADNTAGTISLLFTSVPMLTPAISGNIAISPAQPNHLVIHTQPSATATTGQAFATQPVIYEEDQYGNLEMGDNSTQVTASLRTGVGPLQGTTTVTVSGGIATFTNLADNTAETIILVFTGPTLAKATSNPITVNKDPVNKLVIGAKAKIKVKETSRAKERHAIRGASLLAATRPHTRLAVTPRPRQSSAVPAVAVSSLQAVPTANRARAIVRADSAPVRVPAGLKASLVAYLIALRHAGSDLS
ncbi:MAG: choice-of-anchor Q domain-containing protein [Isosphaerales bacterium]